MGHSQRSVKKKKKKKLLESLRLHFTYTVEEPKAPLSKMHHVIPDPSPSVFAHILNSCSMLLGAWDHEVYLEVS